MIVGLLAMLFIIVSTYIVMARFDRQTIGLAARGSQVGQIIDSVNRVAAAAVGGGSSGGDLVSATAYTDIPGYGGMNSKTGRAWGAQYLASPEPVRSANSPRLWKDALPVDYRYPTVGSFTGKSVGTLRLNQLMLDTDGGGVDPNVNSVDTSTFARQPFDDADGDGMPDSSFWATAPLTELANAMAGQLVRASGINPSELSYDLSDPNYLMWQQYDRQARYAVAVKIVSHGGMVQISAPSTNVQWNSAFISGMFNWIKNPLDTAYSLDLTNISTHRNRLERLGAASAAVEPILRRRGGLLAGGRDGVPAAWPSALWDFYNTLQLFRTLVPQFGESEKAEGWQRYNLADRAEWHAWRDRATLDPTLYNKFFTDGGVNPLVNCSQRQWLTTVNNSDELARIQRPSAEDPNLPLALWPGQFKYYLGRITDPNTGAFRQISSGAPWTFNDTTYIDPNHPTPQGLVVVRELADYFGEMLAGCAPGSWVPDPNASEAVRWREQVLMLAVNTLSFAAPRDPNGAVDAAYYQETVGTTKTYIGYTPQPFITQLIAYNWPVDYDPSDPNKPADPNRPFSDPNNPAARDDIALAIQLYNPNDSVAPTVSTVTHDLDLSRFAISLNNQYEDNPTDPNTLLHLDVLPMPGQHLPGRSFMSLTVNRGTNPRLDAYVTANCQWRHHVPDDPNGLVVKLWAIPAPGSKLGSYIVDQEALEPNRQVVNTPREWTAHLARDRGYEPYLGRWPGAVLPDEGYGRWRVVMPADPNDTETDPNQLSTTVGGELMTNIPSLPSDPNAAGARPCVPLYTMNATMSAAPFIHGTWRPPSFPTVGFMLFIPRFSHVRIGTGSVGGPSTYTYHPMNYYLAQQWEARTKSTGGAATVATAPADFGHMPVFDNEQATDPNGVFTTSKLGTVPWGLLAFDYFTTLDPNDPNSPDPYRVPGRININTAPWYVLAGLPVIGPISTADPNLPLPATDTAAFWSAASGVLTGFEADSPTTPRFAGFTKKLTGGTDLLATYDTSSGWWRLGPYLAQAAAAYRDRIPYVLYDSITEPFGEAYLRNNAVAPYRPPQYNAMRGESDVCDPNNLSYNPTATGLKRGFLTIGELANVAGFDASPKAIATDPGNTLVRGDFMKAVGLLALLDTHFLTTRSNTFTIYATLMDRQNPQASARSQMTVDRSNLLPRLLWQDKYANGIHDPNDTYTILQDNGEPEIIGEREVSYYNARYDD